MDIITFLSVSSFDYTQRVLFNLYRKFRVLNLFANFGELSFTLERNPRVRIVHVRIKLLMLATSSVKVSNMESFGCI